MNILVIQNRMGIGDMVIFLPFIEAISKKYNSPITLLIKESTKAKEYTKNLNFLKNIIYLKRDNKNDEHSGICLLYTSPSPRDRQKSRMPSSA